MIPILGLRELGYKVDMPETLSVPAGHQSIALDDVTMRWMSGFPCTIHSMRR